MMMVGFAHLEEKEEEPLQSRKSTMSPTSSTKLVV
jgi:hypothetical protein